MCALHSVALASAAQLKCVYDQQIHGSEFQVHAPLGSLIIISFQTSNNTISAGPSDSHRSSACCVKHTSALLLCASVTNVANLQVHAACGSKHAGQPACCASRRIVGQSYHRCNFIPMWCMDITLPNLTTINVVVVGSLCLHHAA